MTDIQDEGGDPSRFRDPGIAEALLRLGPEAAAAHPGVLTQCGGTWVHHVCDGRTVEAREVSGAELEVLQARIRDFRDRMESLLALARDSGDAGSGDALKDAALDDAARAFGQGFDRVLGELDGARPDLDAMELQLRDNALSGSAAAYRAVLEARDAALPAPECPRCGRAMKRRRSAPMAARLTARLSSTPRCAIASSPALLSRRALSARPAILTSTARASL